MSFPVNTVWLIRVEDGEDFVVLRKHLAETAVNQLQRAGIQASWERYNINDNWSTPMVVKRIIDGNS